MGIYDRDYIRDDRDRSWYQDEISGTVLLIGLHILLFFFLHAATDLNLARVNENPLIKNLGFSSSEILHGEIWRMFTAHLIPLRDLVTLAVGLFLLYWSGNAVEQLYGRRNFLAFYVVAGFFASVAKLILAVSVSNSQMELPIGIAPCLIAVLVLHACHFPNTKVIFNIPLAFMVGGLVTIYVISGLVRYVGQNKLGDGSSVIAAILFTFAFFRFYSRGRVVTGRNRSSRQSSNTLRLRADTSTETGDEQSPPRSLKLEQISASDARSDLKPVDEQLEAKLDEVLEKVAKVGKSGLTPEEQELLLRASEIYRKRREQSLAN